MVSWAYAPGAKARAVLAARPAAIVVNFMCLSPELVLSEVLLGFSAGVSLSQLHHTRPAHIVDKLP
jgi:Kef-type K+ transport system membrane component KefB